MNSSRFQVLAVNDAKDFCECCGRKGLKRVVWLLDNETGEHKHFGTTCVLSPKHAFGLKEEAKDAGRKFDDELKARGYRARAAYKAAGGKFHPANSQGVFLPMNPELWEECRRASV